MLLVALGILAAPITQQTAQEATEHHGSPNMAPVFASPLHTEDSNDIATKAVSPPMFMKSFETAEETLPFELSLNPSPSLPEVVLMPVTDAEALPQEGTEEVKEELVELELEAELKWVKR